MHNVCTGPILSKRYVQQRVDLQGTNDICARKARQLLGGVQLQTERSCVATRCMQGSNKHAEDVHTEGDGSC